MTSSTSGSTSNPGPVQTAAGETVQRITLQRRLTVGIVGALTVITLFFVLTTALFRDIERFIDRTLTPDISIARLYERYGDLWNQIDDQLIANLSDHTRQEQLVSDELLGRFQGTLLQLDAFVTRPEHRAALIELTRLEASYTRQLRELEHHSRRRGEIARRDGQRRLSAGQSISTRTNELSRKIRRMNDELPRALNDPEFRQLLGSATPLLTTISRIEKDLQIVEAEIRLYMAQKAEPGRSAPGRLALPDRIQNRLQAVLGLIVKSIEGSKSPLHTRVFGNIRSNIIEFKTSFQDLRDLLERPDSEKIEIDDLLSGSRERMISVFTAGQAIIAREAESFWNRIHETSSGLVIEARRDFYATLVFLLLALVGGLSVAITFPGRIAAPLQQLKKQMKGYRLGDNAELPEIQSDTEEIHTLAESFHNLAFSLHEQAEINKTYLKTIQKLTEIYSELESDKAEMVGINKEARLENAVGKVLELLRDTLPGIGLVKIMRKSPASADVPAGFVRLGAPQFTQEFLSSHEYFPYAASTGLPTDHRQDHGREFLPLHEGLTGWYCDNKMLGIQCSDDDRSFFRRSLPLPAVQDNPVLRGRSHEQGLNGCLLLLPLLTPIQAGEATLLSDPEYDEVLFVYFPDPDTRLSLQDVSFVKIIADQLASIIETDKLMTAADKKKKLDTQLQMAREIQENLLPQKTPVIPGLGISRISKSAAEVGGDYYDFFDLGSKRLGLVIADASGKNVPAAIIMTVFKTTLSTMELTKLSAGEVLTRANDIIQLNITNDRFITAMYAIIDATTGEVELACAGHNPAIVVSRRNGPPTLEERSASGLPLGIVSMKYQPTKFTMKPGDLLVLYTDGVTEARNPDAEEYGVERLKRFLGGQQRSDPARAMLDDIGLFTGDAPQYDDITAVTVEFKGNKP